MKLGYARVSGFDEPGYLDAQIEKLIEGGCTANQIYVERRSGMAGHRPSLNRLLGRIRKDDEVLVWKLDRIGRSMNHVVDLICRLNQMGASLTTLGEETVNISTHKNSNTQHMEVFDLLRGFDCKIAAERKLNTSSYRVSTRKLRSSLLLDWTQVEYAKSAVESRSMTIIDICKKLKISPPTLYSYISPTGELRERGVRAMRVKALTTDNHAVGTTDQTHIKQ